MNVSAINIHFLHKFLIFMTENVKIIHIFMIFHVTESKAGK
jgi:hypothetical protein